MLTRKIWDVQHHDENGGLIYRAQYTVWLFLIIPVFIKQTYLYNPTKLPETYLNDYGEERPTGKVPPHERILEIVGR